MNCILSPENPEGSSEIRQLYSDIKEEFQYAEKKIKNLERIGRGLAFPPVNQLRYCGFHLVRAVNSNDVGFIKRELHEAWNHCQRSIHDGIELELMHYVDEIKVFKDDYSTVTITDTVQNYLDILKLADKAKEYILERSNHSVHEHSNHRRNGGENGSSHTEIDTLTRELKAHVETLDVAREELNKKINEYRAKTQNILITGCIGLTGIVIAFLTFIKS